MGYTPLFDTLLNGTMFGRWPHNGIWALLLSRASREGVINEVPESLAAHIGIPVEQLMESIRYFMEPDENSRTPGHDGRRLELIDENRPWGWRVINHAKYREKARKKNYDEHRTETGVDAERKKAERASQSTVPTRPDASREVPLSSPTPNAEAFLKKPANAVERREEAKTIWPRVLSAIQNSDLQKSFPPDSEIGRLIAQLGGWKQLGAKNRHMRGQTEQRFLNAYAEGI